MTMEQTTITEDQLFCEKQEKSITKTACSKCEHHLEWDTYSIFNKCWLRLKYTKAIEKLYKDLGCYEVKKPPK